MKNSGFLILLFFLVACESLISNKNVTPNFKLINNSHIELESFELYVGDQKELNVIDTSKNFIIIHNENPLKSNSLPIFQKNLKKYSKTGNGYFYFYGKKKYSNDTLKIKFGRYNNFDVSNDSYPGYNTYEIIVVDKNSLPNPLSKNEIITKFAKYKGENRIEGY